MLLPHKGFQEGKWIQSHLHLIYFLGKAKFAKGPNRSVTRPQSHLKAVQSAHHPAPGPTACPQIFYTTNI